MDTDRIEKNILLRAPLARVWRALTDSTEFGTWFGVRFDAPFEPGRRMRGAIVPTKIDANVGAAQKPYEGVPFEITIEQILPQRLFSFRWHPYAVDQNRDYSAEPTTLVAFELEEREHGVLLTITESGFDQIPLERRAKAFMANEQGWAMQMKSIEGYLAQER